MAEFQEVMQQLNRLCSHYQNCSDSGCPLFDECGNIGSHSSNKKQAVRVEKTVMSWAAENPEAVYPMWCEWLADKGVVDVVRMPVDYSGGIITEIKPSGKMYEHIPADIAQKLGIQPKEG